ncbi:MAG: hypothetical protein CVV32_01030 [Methanomicrobiales archaeon HGW-Methanomicrobiales-3]|jgi:hypothetical protein|nr:MAG: hypothetical protein CVV32_01030 [Methanomicrobiales archaeon HGW-Methanomicrobiales-3]
MFRFWKITPRIFPESGPLYLPAPISKSGPERTGLERCAMTKPAFRNGFATDEEFFRYHLGRHGIDRSLSGLWQIFHELPAGPVPVPREPFLQHLE